jgi:hypothetical protein
MKDADLAAIGAYLTNQAWAAYDEQERKAGSNAR